MRLVVGQATVGVLSRSYFSSQRRSIWYPALVMAAGLALTVLVSLILLHRWGGMALAAGNAAGITLTAGLLLTGLRRRVVSVSLPAIMVPMIRLVPWPPRPEQGWLVNRLMSGTRASCPDRRRGRDGSRLRRARDRGRGGRTAATGRPGPACAAVPPPGRLPDGADVPLGRYRRRSVSHHRVARPLREADGVAHKARAARHFDAELLDAADRGCAGRLVGITFDDGYADLVTHAFPVLARHGFTATVFLVAGKLGGTNEWDELGPRKPLMSADQVRTAARMGIEIGSHAVSHVRLSELDADVVRREVIESRERLEAVVEAPVRGFCYPYGDVADALELVRNAGYEYAVATRTSARRHRYASLASTSVSATAPSGCTQSSSPPAGLGESRMRSSTSSPGSPRAAPSSSCACCCDTSRTPKLSP